MPPNLRVEATSTQREKRHRDQFSSMLAGVLKQNPKLDVKAALAHIEKNNPNTPLLNGRCAINDLPNEILAQIFRIGTTEEQMDEWEFESDSEEDSEGDSDAEWEDVSGDDDDGDGLSDDGDEAVKTVSRLVQATIEDHKKREAAGKGKLDDDDEDDEDDGLPYTPFPILISHVCKRWREVALETHPLWTSLAFNKRTNLLKSKVYIERSEGLPLLIHIDCMIPDDMDAEDHPDHPLFANNQAVLSRTGTGSSSLKDIPPGERLFLSHKDLTDILDLIEPEVHRWCIFDFHATTYGYIQVLLPRLAKLPAAPLLESLAVYHFEEVDDYEVFSGDDKTPYLPFHGDVPKLKDAVLWGVHIDWDGAVKFLKDLETLELSFHAKDVRPSYPTFVQIIKACPNLQKLNLSLSGPTLPSGVAFNADQSEGGWGREPLEISSITELVIQLHDVKYACALIQHLYTPNVKELSLDFLEEDFTEFAYTLAIPIKGKKKSLLAGLEAIKIAALPCNLAAAETMLSELGNLKRLDIKATSAGEEIIIAKLGNPRFGRDPPDDDDDLAKIAASSMQLAPYAQTASTNTPSIPRLYLPLLETLTTFRVNGYLLQQVLQQREQLGAPKLKKLRVAFGSPVDEKEQKWLEGHVDVYENFLPSDDSSSDEDEDDIGPWSENDEEDSGGSDSEGGGGGGGGAAAWGDSEPFPSPLVQLLDRPRRQRRPGDDLD